MLKVAPCCRRVQLVSKFSQPVGAAFIPPCPPTPFPIPQFYFSGFLHCGPPHDFLLHDTT